MFNVQQKQLKGFQMPSKAKEQRIFCCIYKLFITTDITDKISRSFSSSNTGILSKYFAY